MKTTRLVFAALVLVLSVAACSGDPVGPDTSAESCPTLGSGNCS